MITDIQLENIYRRVQLVSGAGNRQRGQLCIMSLVALLSGEEHSDNPSGVSAMVRRFAMSINDGMPYYLRQRLKPFAPRLIGTMDGQDDKRMALLLSAVHHEILPRAAADHLWGDKSRHELPAQNRGWQPMSALKHPRAWFSRVSNPLWPPVEPQSPDNASAATAQLLTQCARMTGNGRSEWYWLKAIDLLDRLCNVTEYNEISRMEPASLADAFTCLSQSSSSQRDKSWPVAALNRLRTRMPGLLA